MVDNNFRRKEIGRIIKYLLVGVLNTLVGMCSSLFLFNFLGFDKVASTAIGTILGVGNSFFINSRFTFGHKTLGLTTALKFVFYAAIVYGLSYPTVFLLASNLKEASTMSSIFIDNCSIFLASTIYTVIGYLANRLLVFKGNDEEN